ncbi:MAG: hypothetical protein NVSMB68_02650 [Thermoanaerobaculia bacterium]
MRLTSRLLLLLIVTCLSTSLFAQQTGALNGRVTADNSPLPGVTVEARSNVLPQARVTTTDANGEYNLPALPPGTYTLTYSLSGMATVTRRAEALLAQTTAVDVRMGVQGVSENITVTAVATLVNRESTAIESGLSTQQIQALPVGQQYRDILKLIPGVQQTPFSTRGPSGGGSGQDNVYQFDGVNVTLPLYGTLAAEPASYDIAQVSIVKGGAKAVDFDRSGGFTIDSVSKSGTNKFSGQASFQVQNHSMTSNQKVTSAATFDQDQSWTTLSLGGPVIRDMLFFYGSYYRPEVSRSNQANNYGALPKFNSTRNEGFGKLTFTPTSNILVNGSYRDSKNTSRNLGFGSFTAPSAGQGAETKQNIGTVEASWIMNPISYLTGKFTDFGLRTHGVPLNPLSITPTIAIGTHIDINNLAQYGLVNVPCFAGVASGQNACNPANAPASAVNAFRSPFVNQYGYTVGGGRFGGGAVGASDTLLDKDDFFRRSGQLGYKLTLGSHITHDLHAGYQAYTDTEELQRLSNGFGSISVPGGSSKCPSSSACKGQPIFFQASFYLATLGDTPGRRIKAPYKSKNIELNDTIRAGNWTFNAGVMASNDTLYGQGLRNDSSALSGYVLAPGNRYKMYNIPFSREIQPRLGATWAYNGEDTIYTSYSSYNPAASSLPRAASWDRNYTIRRIRAYFDQNGNLIGSDPLRSSAGKLFVPDMKPRQVKEYLVGSSQQLNQRWSARLYGRYRYSNHFWEDTNNTARIDYREPSTPSNVPAAPYIPNLGSANPPTGFRGQIGSGSSYVIADLDNAFTKYYEATAESEWHGNKAFLRGSYTWSHYYGNFDQDNTSCAGCNDANIYIGSSYVADGPGRQLWDMKYGNMHGDRRHLLKLFGAYSFPWNGSVGAYGVYQSGQPWEAWNYELYNFSEDNDEDDTNKFAEHAGSRRSPAHYQMDLNYTQNIPLHGINLQLVGDLFNVLNKQTGYDFQPSVHSANFGQPQFYWSPRRFQLAARVQF